MVRTSVRRRPGFTLLELIVVMAIMSVIITLAVIFLPNLNRNKGVPNGATQVEGWVRVTRGQALRDGAPRGVRLIPDANDPTRVTSIQYIEQPDPVSPRGQNIRVVVSTPNPNTPLPPPYPNPSQTTVQLGNGVTAATMSWFDQGVAINDFFELTGTPGVIARIVNIGGVNNSILQLDRSIEGTDIAPLVLAEGYRVVRAPRPLAGEPLVQLHKDVYIDLLNCYPCPILLNHPVTGLPVGSGSPPYGNGVTFYAPWSFSGYYDILFNSSGHVANAATGQVILAVQHVDRLSDKLFVVIYTRTGKVTAVSPYDIGNNPYLFAQDGRGPGL
jgi:prepilin-type N-terminal cleavage/methylation domain-containing protein